MKKIGIVLLMMSLLLGSVSVAGPFKSPYGNAETSNDMSNVINSIGNNTFGTENNSPSDINDAINSIGQSSIKIAIVSKTIIALILAIIIALIVCMIKSKDSESFSNAIKKFFIKTFLIALVISIVLVLLV